MFFSLFLKFPALIVLQSKVKKVEISKLFLLFLTLSYITLVIPTYIPSYIGLGLLYD